MRIIWRDHTFSVMRWWIVFFCFNCIHTVASFYVCTTFFTEPRNEACRKDRRECICNLYKSLRQDLWITYMAPSWLPACFVLLGEQEKEDVILFVSHLTNTFRHSFSLVLVYISSVSCFPYQVPAPSKEGKSVIKSWWIKYSLNLFIYHVCYVLPFPCKQLCHHFYIWHQAEKPVLIAPLLKLWELLLLLPTV